MLELYARSRILRETGKVDAEEKMRFTCNQFLNCFGEPTKVEARIGVIFREEGLQAAFDHIRETFEPLFAKQKAKRKRQSRL